MNVLLVSTHILPKDSRKLHYLADILGAGDPGRGAATSEKAVLPCDRRVPACERCVVNEVGEKGILIPRWHRTLSARVWAAARDRKSVV